MRWHFPIMRAMGGREGITALAGPAIDRDWHFPLQSKNVHVLLSCCVCVCVFACGLRFVLAADGEEVIHLVTAISKSLHIQYVCEYICVPGRLCTCGTSACLGAKTSACLCVWRAAVRWKSVIYGREWCWKALGTATPVNPDKKTWIEAI